MPKRKNVRQKYGVEGADELQAALSRLSDASRPKIMRAGLDQASSLVLDEMKRKVPRKTGELREHLVRWVNVRKGEATSAAIGPKKVKGHWWSARGRWLEYGTEAHGKGGGNMRPQPFMRPALDDNVQRIYRVMSHAMWDAIKRLQ